MHSMPASRLAALLMRRTPLAAGPCVIQASLHTTDMQPQLQQQGQLQQWQQQQPQQWPHRQWWPQQLQQQQWPQQQWWPHQQHWLQQQQHWQQRQQQQQQCRGMSSGPTMHSTTILCIREGAEVVIMGDGQATQGDFVVKPNVKKVRRVGSSAVGGFAGVAVDGLALLERLETKLEEHPGQLQRAAVELAMMWRQDKLLRELDASLIVADACSTFWLMGNGDVLEAEPDGVIGIGSGADFAESAARALLQLRRDLQQQQQQQEGQQGGAVDAAQAGSSGSGSGSSGSSGDGSLGTAREQAAAPEAPAAADASAAAGVSSASGGGGVPPELLPVLHMSLFDVAHAAMSIAASSCIYTNTNFSWLHIRPDGSIHAGESGSGSDSGRSDGSGRSDSSGSSSGSKD